MARFIHQADSCPVVRRAARFRQPAASAGAGPIRRAPAGRISLLLILLVAIFPAVRGQAPRNAEDLLNRAQQRYKANDFEGAIDDLTLLIELASRSQRRELRTKNDPSEDWGRAIAPRATGAVVVDPRVAAAFTARGIVKIAKQDYDGAIADF